MRNMGFRFGRSCDSTGLVVALVAARGHGTAIDGHRSRGAARARTVEVGHAAAEHLRVDAEALYPSAIEECYTVAEWVGATGAEHGLDGNRMAVAGDSVGGNIAAAL